MRIAFITYDYPTDIARGGIGTYVQQAAIIFKSMGHDVEVFCGSLTRNVSEINEGVLVHSCLTKDPDTFRSDCLTIFSDRHNAKPFDIIESPEIHANALLIKDKFPQIPLVVKLHMALFIQMRLYNFYTPLSVKIRFFLGALKKGKINYLGNYNYKTDKEYIIANNADSISSPSISLREIIIKEWKIPADKIQVLPYPFDPPEELLNIPIQKPTKKKVTFIGKLNVHKGLVNLVKVIPEVAQKHPDVLFTLIGNDSFFGTKNMAMSEYIKKELAGYENNYEILGGLDYGQVLKQLSATSICIFPSIWENFPLVCLEAMGAGRAIIGSKEGGMNEMLSDGAGIIIDPLNTQQMAASIISLLSDDSLCVNYGEAARKKVLSTYNKVLIGKRMEDYYQTVIANFKK